MTTSCSPTRPTTPRPVSERNSDASSKWMRRASAAFTNAAAFSLTGGGALPIRLSAQFVTTRLSVTGNATINLVPNPEDSIPVRIYTTLLVR